MVPILVVNILTVLFVTAVSALTLERWLRSRFSILLGQLGLLLGSGFIQTTFVLQSTSILLFGSEEPVLRLSEVMAMCGLIMTVASWMLINAYCYGARLSRVRLVLTVVACMIVLGSRVVGLMVADLHGVVDYLPFFFLILALSCESLYLILKRKLHRDVRRYLLWMLVPSVFALLSRGTIIFAFPILNQGLWFRYLDQVQPALLAVGLGTIQLFFLKWRSSGRGDPSLEEWDEELLTSRLSPREREVAILMAQGVPNSQIAEKLFVSPKTVEKHVSSVYRNLKVNNRMQLYHLVRKNPPKGN